MKEFQRVKEFQTTWKKHNSSYIWMYTCMTMGV